MNDDNDKIWNVTLPSDFALQPIPRPSVLLVDDRDENLVATRRILERLEADIVCARSGFEALSLSLRQQFAVILLDVQMPGIDGFETADLLRQNETTQLTPIIFLTAINKDEVHVFKGYGSGAVDYIAKPFDPAILLSKIRVFLDLERQRLALKRLVHSLEQLNARHSLLLECAAEGIMGIDGEGGIVFANPTAQKLLHAENQLVGASLLTFIDGPEVKSGSWAEHPLHKASIAQYKHVEQDTILYRANGQTFAAEYNYAPLPARQGISGGVIVFQDISLRKALYEKLEQMAKYDELTGIANRHLFLDLLEKSVSRAQRNGKRLFLLYMDLDGFKGVNDHYGHHMGDLLLRAFSDRVKDRIRLSDLFARLGGDEFLLLMEGNSNLQEVKKIAEELIDVCSAEYELEGHAVSVGVSIGIAAYPVHANCADTLIAQADAALYEAKNAGRGVVKFCSEQS